MHEDNRLFAGALDEVDWLKARLDLEASILSHNAAGARTTNQKLLAEVSSGSLSPVGSQAAATSRQTNPSTVLEMAAAPLKSTSAHVQASEQQERGALEKDGDHDAFAEEGKLSGHTSNGSEMD